LEIEIANKCELLERELKELKKQENFKSQGQKDLESSIEIFKQHKNSLQKVKNRIKTMLACGNGCLVDHDRVALQNKVNTVVKNGVSVYSELAPVCKDLFILEPGSDRSNHALLLKSKFDKCKQNKDFTDYCKNQSLVLCHFKTKETQLSKNTNFETLRQSLGEDTVHNNSFGKHIIKIFKICREAQEKKEVQKHSRQNTYRNRSNTAPVGDITNDALSLKDPSTPSNNVLQIKGTPTSRKQKSSSTAS
jgi:hypothetical protein